MGYYRTYAKLSSIVRVGSFLLVALLAGLAAFRPLEGMDLPGSTLCVLLAGVLAMAKTVSDGVTAAMKDSFGKARQPTGD